MIKRKKNLYLIRILGMQICATPFHTLFIIIIILLEAIGLTARTIFTQNLFDVIIEAVDKKSSFIDCLIAIIVMGVITLSQQAINGIKFFYWSFIIDKASGKNSNKLFKKLQRVSPENFENTEFLDNLNKAKEGIRPLTSVALNILNIVFFDMTYALTLGIYLFNMCPSLVITLLLAFIPAVISQTVRIKLFAKLEEESAPIRRQNDYYYRAICDRMYFKETRILGAFSYFNNLFSETLELLINIQWKVEKKTTFMDICLNIISFIGMGVSILLLFVSTMKGEISVGAFAAIFASLSTIFGVMQSMMSWDVTCISNDIGKVVNYFKMLDCVEVLGKDGEKQKSETIYATKIKFKYPLSNEYTIDDVSIEIGSGETIAIVGENGSGKSTLVRLLTGIYRPSEGTVNICGLDTSIYNLNSLHKNISGVFQKFPKYKMSLLDNVSISDMSKNDMKCEEVERVLEKSGFDYSEEKVELDTLLSPEFGGVDLSGGQWQRIAIARGLYRTSDFIVLDEPTAAIDPIEENRVFTQFNQIVSGKSSIVVTHRLGSTRLADKIVVLDKGKIVDVGTHEELLSHEGKYAELWNAQAEWYDR